ncbi:hypothetical protein THTE_0309 [Thermogutta terrifontis]|uniref:Uncharacterized protein n=1 Tax=Thermogutta terrifontis TaxID=1331910 RepID=A0A286RAD9_9BACT|nr:hypothetical protein THTE_0309 [Thermogutta terrifontis]
MNCPYDLGGTFSGGTRLSGPFFDVGSSISLPRARQACSSDLSEEPACRVRLVREPAGGCVICTEFAEAASLSFSRNKANEAAWAGRMF